MNQEFKEEWCQALESDEFKQGTSLLVSNGKCCCLGVACILINRKGKLSMSKSLYGDAVGFGDSKSIALLPKEAIDFMELKDSSPSVVATLNDVKRTYNLSSLNDNGMSFKEIAKLIREQL